MATVLLAWELGAGMGHLATLRPIAEELVRRNHRVIAAVRDIGRCDAFFNGLGIQCLPAPVLSGPVTGRFDPLQTYAHILFNVGFGDPRELATLVRGWDEIYAQCRPDLVIVNHAPTALLALRGHHAKCLTVGTGFCSPPDSDPLPRFERPWSNVARRRDPAQLECDEKLVLTQVNTLLASRAQPPLPRLSQLFNDVDAVCLATFAELDHFGTRPATRYWGNWPRGVGMAPDWPAGNGSKIYAYLKPFEGLPVLLDALRRSQLRTLVVVDGVQRDFCERFASDTLHFVTRPLELGRTAAECDYAILNAGHGTTAAALLAGKPCLMLPLQMEQYLLAKRVEQLGAGRVASPRTGGEIVAELQELLSSARFSAAARTFSEKYADWSSTSQIFRIADLIDELLLRRS